MSLCFLCQVYVCVFTCINIESGVDCVSSDLLYVATHSSCSCIWLATGTCTYCKPRNVSVPLKLAELAIKSVFR